MISARERLAWWLGFTVALRGLKLLPQENYDLWLPVILDNVHRIGPTTIQDYLDLTEGNSPFELLPLVKTLPPFLEIPR